MTLAWISVDSGTDEIFLYLAVKSSKEIHAIVIQDPWLASISLDKLSEGATFSLDGNPHDPKDGFNQGQAKDAYWVIGQFEIPSGSGVGNSYSYSVTAQGEGHEISGKISVTGGEDPSTTANYTVEHYLQNLDDDEYILEETDSLTGAIGEETAAVAKTYEGFTARDDFNQEVIAADGTTVIEIYYDRIEYTINYLAGANGSIEGLTEQEVKYGGNTTEVTAVAAQGYRFVKWEEDNNTVAARSETEVKANATYTAIFEASDDAVYTVKHYKELLAGGYPTTASETETKSGTTGAQTSATANAYEGFTARDDFNQEAIAADGTTVIGIYYDRNSYSLTYAITGDYFTDAVFAEDSYLFGASVKALDAPFKSGYTFHGWTSVPGTMPAKDVTVTGHYTRNYVAPDPQPAMTVTKVGEYVDVNENDYLNVGDRIDYTITVTNTGDVVLTDIKVVDPLIGLDLRIDQLGVEESWEHLGSYLITGADIDAEKVINTVTVTANELEDPITTREETLLDGEVEEVVGGEEVEEEEDPKEPTDPEVPVTGEALAWQYPALGALLMALGAVVLVLRRKEHA